MEIINHACAPVTMVAGAKVEGGGRVAENKAASSCRTVDFTGSSAHLARL